LDASQTAPLLIATAPTRYADRYAAILVVIVSLVAFFLIAPFANAPSPLMVAFVPATDTGSIVIDVITAMLLIGQFAQLRRPSLLVLSCGYSFAAFIVLAHLLSAAAVVRSLRPQTANAVTTAGVFTLWHSIFPIFIMLYAILSRSDRDRPFARSLLPKAISLGILAALALAGLCVLIAISVPRPSFADADRAFELVAAGATWFISAAALAVLYARTRARRILDMWLCIVLFAWLLDILIGSLISGTPFNFGWYAGRLYGVLAASAVMVALLLESGSLYGQLTRAFSELQTQSAALLQSEAALRQAQKMEAIGQITGGLAHDFNNLLTVIIGSLDMLAQQKDSTPRVQRLTDFAMQAAVKGEKLTKQLLAFSRQQMLNPEIKDPNSLIRDFEGLLRRALGETIEITLKLEAGLGPIRVDPAQFESAILNLAVNARDAMDGKGAIVIETRHVTRSEIAALIPEAKAGSYVLVSLSDTGVGMDAETVSRAFEPFFTTKPTGKGTGLGLSQVYGFATSSQGFVRIDSAPGDGTTVKLYLPRVDGDVAAAVAPDPDESAPLVAGGEVVLIVEDDPGVREMAIESLIELGYGILTAASGPEALEVIRGGARIDILFSDIVMPGGMNGVELSVEAHRIRPDIRILLTSGYAAGALTGDDVPEGLNVIAKPYRLEDLSQKLQQVLSG